MHSERRDAREPEEYCSSVKTPNRVTLMAENICLLRYPSMPLLTFLTGGQNLKANNPFDEGI